MAENSDKFLRAYLRLKALRQSLPEGKQVGSHWVTEYHQIIAQISSDVSLELSEFTVPNSAIKPQGTIFRPGLGSHPISDVRLCDRGILAAKMDALLLYIGSLLPPEEKERIGFHS